jgi:two-component system phosphate regulon sensor histidine kinase PhoR
MYDKLQKKKSNMLFIINNKVKESTGKPPQKEDLLEYGYYQRNSKLTKQ